MMLITLENGEWRYVNPNHIAFAYESNGPFGHYVIESTTCEILGVTQESYERIVKWMEEDCDA